jgi:hypothetical protein
MDRRLRPEPERSARAGITRIRQVSLFRCRLGSTGTCDHATSGSLSCPPLLSQVGSTVLLLLSSPRPLSLRLSLALLFFCSPSPSCPPPPLHPRFPSPSPSSSGVLLLFANLPFGVVSWCAFLPGIAASTSPSVLLLLAHRPPAIFQCLQSLPISLTEVDRP